MKKILFLFFSCLVYYLITSFSYGIVSNNVLILRQVCIPHDYYYVKHYHGNGHIFLFLFFLVSAYLYIVVV